jgi:hypothetical protein
VTAEGESGMATSTATTQKVVDVLSDQLSKFLNSRREFRTDDLIVQSLSSEGPLERKHDVHSASWSPWIVDGRQQKSNEVLPYPSEILKPAQAVLGRVARGSSTVSRLDLVDLATQAQRSPNQPQRDEALVALWVATMMWGSGTTYRRGPWRTSQGLRLPQLHECLQTTRQLVVDGDLKSAFATLSYGPLKIPGCGEAFFTKWLWAASLSDPELPIRPLILDARVKATIKKATGQINWVKGADGYVSYCRTLHAVANQLTDSTKLAGITGEKVEWLLFDRNEIEPNAFKNWVAQAGQT